MESARQKQAGNKPKLQNTNIVINSLFLWGFEILIIRMGIFYQVGGVMRSIAVLGTQSEPRNGILALKIIARCKE